MQKTFKFSGDDDNFDAILNWLYEQSKEWTDNRDTWKITIKTEVVKAPFLTPWSQAPNKAYMLRRTCPICGTPIPKDDAIGQMESFEYCPANEKHYSRFSSIFADSIRILGKSFEPKDTEGIHNWLEQKGNKEFMA